MTLKILLFVLVYQIGLMLYRGKVKADLRQLMATHNKECREVDMMTEPIINDLANKVAIFWPYYLIRRRYTVKVPRRG